MPGDLSTFLYKDEKQCVEALLAALPWDAARAARVHGFAADLIERVRAAKRKTGELESFLRQYGLDTEEGLALMTLAEALLRIPDAATADMLIRDKMQAADWLVQQNEGGGGDLMVKAAGLGLSLARKTLDSAVGGLGGPVIRKAMTESIRVMGRQFVLGRTMDEASKAGRDYAKKGYNFSFDMLGEGARTAEDAERYFAAYSAAIPKIAAGEGLSVKLSALYPRYDYKNAAVCVPELAERLSALARLAMQQNIALTVDAEEADRLDLSLDIFAAVLADPVLKGWDGLGLAVQAYGKRTHVLIDHLAEMARGRKIQVRLVKGAYWDTEVKRAQVAGYPGYPVFTRKANTDLSWIACAHKLLQHRDRFYPMFATHNAHSIAAVVDLAGADKTWFEFQRLHGMGEALYDIVLADKLAPVRIYAPVGSHEDLLPYLVRRLLENGANSSFVNKLLDPAIPAAEIAADPVVDARAHETKYHPRILQPSALYGVRTNAAGVDLAAPFYAAPLLREIKAAGARAYEAAPLIGGKAYRAGQARVVASPVDGRTVGSAYEADEELVEMAFETAQKGFASWSETPAETRATALERFADLMEADRAALLHLCIAEGGKTVEDSVAELREAVDFCRYYALTGRRDFAAAGHVMAGPTGESNILTLHGRGVFVCISPWNFPLAIFTGQVAAALMAGNAVIAKPASPTPLVAMRAVELMHKAGIPADAVNLLPGSGRIGGVMVAQKNAAGVAFTGSTEVGWQINRALAARNTAMAPLIAETGGQNAMIVDSSALPEQVVDDVITSAFTSAGQRCSALRVLYVQDDIADKVITMLAGAMQERRVSDPGLLATDIGPVIDAKSRAGLEKHVAWLQGGAGKFVAAIPMDKTLYEQGSFFAPVAYEIGSIRELEREVFGPVLHIVRWKAGTLDRVIDDINASGFGLTAGLHTRIGSVMDHVAGRVKAGNIYINRTMIGAVVGVQPFGGRGLSGTGPKAGGPHYLHRFATERVVSIDTTRQGGNATLVSLTE